MEYRFKYQIVDEDDNDVITGSTYFTNIDEFGNCESVDLEIGSGLRYFKKLRAVHEEREKELAEKLNEDEDENN